MNNCAILIRGHTKRHRRDSRDPIDFDCVRGSIESFVENVLEPLKSLYNLDVYIIASDSENTVWLCKKIQPRQIWFSITNDELSQSTNMLAGLKNLRRQKNYNKIFITRFDILYKDKLTKFIENKQQDVLLPFWDVPTTENRVGDALHWINNDDKNVVLDRFIESIQDVRTNTKDFNTKYPWEKRERTFHDLYNSLIQKDLKVGFMTDGQHDSCTSRPPGTWQQSANSKNPIYVFSGRKYYFDDYKHTSLLS